MEVFFTELKDKGIKNEKNRTVNDGETFIVFSAHSKENRNPRLILECASFLCLKLIFKVVFYLLHEKRMGKKKLPS